ncbi:hypothetical protein PS896_03294 [Pseudomonas fluorescens]|uniref:Uncharacterized protein n=1 Tax=Pseudomonas fluorescens TaxID=294 RepID=A0A5E7LF70_PSEFL|nr:hypothetical protein [Pseudomonas fluorescens]VVP10188.1 hypothetical protein PS896_03294 [Pseudomonas fluorescens]
MGNGENKLIFPSLLREMSGPTYGRALTFVYRPCRIKD